MPAVLQVVYAAQTKAQLVTFDSFTGKQGTRSLQVLLQRAAAKHKLKHSKKKPLSLFSSAGEALTCDDQLDQLKSGDLVLLCATEGDRREVARRVSAAAEAQHQEVSAIEGVFPEEVWFRIFGALQPPRGPEGWPLHLAAPPSHPPIFPQLAMTCRLFASEVYKLWNPRALFPLGAGQWFWRGRDSWVKYSPAANADIEFGFTRGERVLTVHISEHDQTHAGAKRQGHVAINYPDMVQTNLSKKGIPIPICRWPSVTTVQSGARSLQCEPSEDAVSQLSQLSSV